MLTKILPQPLCSLVTAKYAVTRVTGLRNPPPTPTKEERLGAWAARYFSLPVEQRMKGVGYIDARSEPEGRGGVE